MTAERNEGVIITSNTMHTMKRVPFIPSANLLRDTESHPVLGSIQCASIHLHLIISQSVPH